MQSVLHKTFGEPVDVLELGEAPVPEPKAGQVRIKTILTPIHNHDVWTVRGRYGYKPELPAIGGSEAVGLIDALGEGVEHLQVGQRVSVASVHNTWAEYFLAPAAGVVPLPDEIDDQTAAQLIGMPISALMLLDFIGIQPGQWMIQNTANGAVGKTVAMIAKSRGIGVINLVRRQNAVDEMTALGIEHVVATEQDDWKAHVKTLLGEHTLVAGVDSIGGQASAEVLSLLGDDSTLVSFGSMTGEPMQLPSGDLIFKQAVVKGFWASVVSKNMEPAHKRELLSELIQLAASKQLQLPVEAILSFDQVDEAARLSTQSGRKGKVLFKPN
ncbi:zinc-binding dehydrogenase [Acinetobacter soli]|uniref:zinc-binding dehydrogenase n=1 Tax=Acinetobacter soli TaxID=487316 RepID=UPI0030197ED7